jgi:O-antigen/teichoic acid export membrane protein
MNKEIMELVNKYLSKFFSNKEEMDKVKKVIIPSFAVHAVAGVLGLSLVLVLTRSLGAKEYGIYTYAFAVIGIITGICSSGFTMLAVRETSALLSKGKAELWKGFYQWALKRLVIICIAAVCLSAAFVWVFTYNFHILKETVYTQPLLYAFITIPFFGLMYYYSSLLLGKHETVLALSVDNVIRPFFLLLFLLAALLMSVRANAINAINMGIASSFLALLFVFFAFRKKTVFTNEKAEYNTPAWKKAMWALILLAGLSSINAKLDILALGYFTNSASVGIYKGAARIAAVIILFMIVTNRIFAASISHLHTTGQKEKLQKMITKICRWVLLLSIPLFLIITLCGRWILSFLGADFMIGQTALIILCAGQLVGVAMGPVGTLSLMTGNEKINVIFVIVKLLAGILLNVILVPAMGINGAALASALTNVLWNFGMFIAVKKKTGIRSWVLG